MVFNYERLKLFSFVLMEDFVIECQSSSDSENEKNQKNNEDDDDEEKKQKDDESIDAELPQYVERSKHVIGKRKNFKNERNNNNNNDNERSIVEFSGQKSSNNNEQTSIMEFNRQMKEWAESDVFKQSHAMWSTIPDVVIDVIALFLKPKYQVYKMLLLFK